MRSKFIYIILFILYAQISAQVFSRKWEKVIDFDDKDIFIDTSNINQEKNIISTLIITYYKKPSLISSLNKEIIYMKTQALFDIDAKKVTIVGNLYYDKNLKILSEPFKPIQIVSENNTHFIDTSKIYSAVLDSCLSYLKRNPAKKYQTKILYDEAKGINKRNEEKNQIQNKNEGKLESNVLENEEYDFNKERNVNKTIFTDGKRFCIQVSSWKEEYKAEREVNRLKSEGHNAFYVKVNIPGKGIWFRVRIGYFSTQEEAEEYERKMR